MFKCVRLAELRTVIRRDHIMLNWLRALIGLAIVGIGMAVFLGVPLPQEQCMTCGIARYAISTGGLVTFIGMGVLMSAVRKFD